MQAPSSRPNAARTAQMGNESAGSSREGRGADLAFDEDGIDLLLPGSFTYYRMTSVDDPGPVPHMNYRDATDAANECPDGGVIYLLNRTGSTRQFLHMGGAGPAGSLQFFLTTQLTTDLPVGAMIGFIRDDGEGAWVQMWPAFVGGG